MPLHLNKARLFQNVQMAADRGLPHLKRLRNQRHAHAKCLGIGGPLFGEMLLWLRQQAQDLQPERAMRR